MERIVSATKCLPTLLDTDAQFLIYAMHRTEIEYAIETASLPPPSLSCALRPRWGHNGENHTASAVPSIYETSPNPTFPFVRIDWPKPQPADPAQRSSPCAPRTPLNPTESSQPNTDAGAHSIAFASMPPNAGSLCHVARLGSLLL